jgi:copper chaperone CopZ
LEVDEIMNANSSALVLSVSGMSCGSCVRHVREALLGVDGVREVDVNLEQGRATIEYDAARTEVEAMVAAVGKAGYAASAKEAPNPVAPPAPRRDHGGS